jgi:hypothetical protein
VRPGRPDIRQIVDGLLGAEKHLAGLGEWQDDRDGVKRFTRAVEQDGEITALELVIKAYPRRTQPCFRILLTMGRAIWRVDFDHRETHINPRLPRRSEVGPPSGLIKGPHYHAWMDNRRFATTASLPQKLKNARFMPDRIRSYEQAFRWFCAETNIELGRGDLPELPERDTLL